jgi:ribonucleoside-diphosphate reductase beta chain
MLIEATELEIEWSQYALHSIDGINLEELEGYIKKLCNRRLRGLGLEDYYQGVNNSMPWMIAYDDNSDANTKTDNFENKSRNYKKVNEDNNLDDL